MPKVSALLPGIAWKKRLLFYRVALQPGDIAKWHKKLPVNVGAYLADTPLTWKNNTMMTTSMALKLAAVGINDVVQFWRAGGHRRVESLL
jgi:hypothetical protein